MPAPVSCFLCFVHEYTVHQTIDSARWGPPNSPSFILCLFPGRMSSNVPCAMGVHPHHPGGSSNKKIYWWRQRPVRFNSQMWQPMGWVTKPASNGVGEKLSSSAHLPGDHPLPCGLSSSRGDPTCVIFVVLLILHSFKVYVSVDNANDHANVSWHCQRNRTLLLLYFSTDKK